MFYMDNNAASFRGFWGYSTKKIISMVTITDMHTTVGEEVLIQ
jgi:hypothetical protein